MVQFQVEIDDKKNPIKSHQIVESASVSDNNKSEIIIVIKCVFEIGETKEEIKGLRSDNLKLTKGSTLYGSKHKSKFRRGISMLINSDLYKSFFTKLIGKKHTKAHRITCGVAVMVVGILIAKLGGHYFENVVADYFFDGTGYLIHAIGATPLLELLGEEA